MRRRSRPVRRLLVLEVVTVLATVLIAAGVSAVGTASLVEADATARMLGPARTVAASPGIAPAVPRPGRAPLGRTLDELGGDPALADRLADPSPVTDETVLVGERLLLLNRTRADDDGSGRIAWVVTLRDRTEVEQVMRALGLALVARVVARRAWVPDGS